MSKILRILPANCTVTVLFKGQVVAKTTDALRVCESDRPEILYLPRESLCGAWLEAYPRRSFCPTKGQASHYTLVSTLGRSEGAVWCYEAPYEIAAQITRYIAFYPQLVDEIQVRTDK